MAEECAIWWTHICPLPRRKCYPLSPRSRTPPCASLTSSLRQIPKSRDTESKNPLTLKTCNLECQFSVPRCKAYRLWLRPNYVTLRVRLKRPHWRSEQCPERVNFKFEQNQINDCPRSYRLTGGEKRGWRGKIRRSKLGDGGEREVLVCLLWREGATENSHHEKPPGPALS